jgi:hypothetical protein
MAVQRNAGARSFPGCAAPGETDKGIVLHDSSLRAPG